LYDDVDLKLSDFFVTGGKILSLWSDLDKHFCNRQENENCNHVQVSFTSLCQPGVYHGDIRPSGEPHFPHAHQSPFAVRLLKIETLSLFSASSAACSVTDIVGSSSQEFESVNAGIDRTYNYNFMLLLTELGRFPNKAVQVSGDPLSASNGNGDKKRS